MVEGKRSRKLQRRSERRQSERSHRFLVLLLGVLATAVTIKLVVRNRFRILAVTCSGALAAALAFALRGPQQQLAINARAKLDQSKGQCRHEPKSWESQTWVSHFDARCRCPRLIGGGKEQFFVIHVCGGLERLAVEELRARGCTHIAKLQGKVCFASTEPVSSMIGEDGIKCAESVGLLMWAEATPDMSVDCNAEAWLDRFSKLLRESCKAGIPAMDSMFRKAVTHPRDQPIRFRCSVKRSGNQSKGVTSVQMEVRLASLFDEWVVSLRDWDVEVFMHWTDVQVTCELPVCNRYHLGERRISRPSYMVYPALHAPIAWGMAKVAQIKHGAVVVDPMVGRGATLIEAQRSFSDATYIGFDTCPAQLSAARGNVAAAEATIELSLGDATKMTLENDSVDVFLCDMPFGKRHGTQLDNCVLYPLVLSEMRRVLRVDGVAVILTTCKRLIEMQVLEGDGWRAVSRDQVVIGAIKGWIHKIEKCGR